MGDFRAIDEDDPPVSGQGTHGTKVKVAKPIKWSNNGIENDDLPLDHFTGWLRGASRTQTLPLTLSPSPPFSAQRALRLRHFVEQRARDVVGGDAFGFGFEVDEHAVA